MKPIWASRGWRARILTPIAFIFSCVVKLRTTLYNLGLLKTNKFDVPVIVVGNISVGGTGKTPIVTAVVNKLKAAGFKPGIVSRGYGAQTANLPRDVFADTPAHLAGDEPLLLAQSTGVPVCICTDRSLAVTHLLENNKLDVVISDDGMQHYAMHRDVELAVVDGQRLLGNGWLVPAGPLREPPKRLSQVDLIAIQQAADATDEQRRAVIEKLKLKTKAAHFHLAITGVKSLADEQTFALSTWHNKPVHAVAGLGNPQRFFSSLQVQGLHVQTHAMPDHHRYTADDLNFGDQHPILVTSKDAVKIRDLDINLSRVFEVMVEAKLDEPLNVAIDEIIKRIL